jgi:AcrR family transcriptional regulator
METKTDRRILRTKKAINRAFLELFTEKEFDRITINDISERADVNRGTFYLHYMDKYDLLDQCIDEHLNRMIHSCTFSKLTEEKVERVEAIEALKSLFVYFEENFLFFSSMLSNKKTSAFRERMLEFLSSAIQKKIHIQGINQNMDKELIVQFMASAFVGTVESWILNRMPNSPQMMAEQIWTLFERNDIQ